MEAALLGGSDDPYELRQIVEKLTEMIDSRNWLSTLHAYSRCKRLVRDLDEIHERSPDIDGEEASKNLDMAYLSAKQRMEKSQKPVETFAQVLIELQEPIDRFFEDVLVMDENEDLRRARLALVQHIVALADGIADLSQLEGF
ncbi:MAG TPA: hypothetical protein DIU35_18760 [Candidatus Latescibacteria bacterium]|nr:hypothetical protein [Candidatus Latescibacterota bacterium]